MAGGAAYKGIDASGNRIGALLLMLPLFLFLVLTFIVPIGTTLLQGFYDPVVARGLPQTAHALRGFDGQELPEGAVYAALASDMANVEARDALAKAAARINSELPGFRSLFFKTTSALRDGRAPTLERFTAIDRRWGEPATWTAIASLSGSFTDTNLLAALDLTRDPSGAIVASGSDRAIFLSMLGRTLLIAGVVTIVCLLVGFPLAYLIAVSSPAWAAFLMLFVLLPLWTSILVRTLAWSVLLQREGIVNGLLVGLGVPGAPFDLLYNRTAVVVGMVHVLLPFMVLALYAVMKQIDMRFLRAASSLGAAPFTVFRRIYLPLVMPGIMSGSLLVFIQALGAYVTPVLLGGPGDQTIAGIIAFYVTRSTNWGLAAALSLILLTTILLLSLVYRGIAGARRVEVGT